MKQLPLTICIITHRADERMKAALESACIAAEVLVIDNHSGINWTGIEEMPFIHIHTLPEPITDFAAVRNQALALAEHEWVLFLDSDEVLGPESHAELQQFLDAPTTQAASVIRSDIFHSKELQYGEAGQQIMIRLCHKQHCTFEQAVHEEARVRGVVFPSKIKILHYSHPTISEFIESVATYAQMIGAQKKVSKRRLLVELLFFPVGKFFYGILIQGGFLDGWRGIVYAACMSLHSLLVRAYAYETWYL